jgi:hypothetical protein
MTILRAIAPGQRHCSDCDTVIAFDAYLADRWRCPKPHCGFRDLTMPCVVPLYLGGRLVGYQSTAGRCLDTAAFWRLGHADRLRAYLRLCHPWGRLKVTLGRVCRVNPGWIDNYLAPDLRTGTIEKVMRGRRVVFQSRIALTEAE